MTSRANNNSPTRKFIRKIIYNFLKEIRKEKYGYSEFLRGIMRENPELLVGELAVGYFNELKESYEEEKKEKNFIIESDYMKELETSKFLELFEDEYPEVRGPFEVSENVEYLANLLDLTDIEKIMAEFYIIIDGTEYHDQSAFYPLVQKYRTPSEFISIAFDYDRREIDKIFNQKTSLLTCGILFERDHGNFNGHYEFDYRIHELVARNEPLTDEIIERELFPSSLDTDLVIEDYPHLTKEIEILGDVIDNSITKNLPGINAMLWGVPGTGKTELIVSLAKLHNWDLRIIGDISRTNDEESGRHGRLASLKMAQKIFTNQKKRNIVLVFDEMEDLFRKKDTDYSKAYINRTIEKTELPIIWTTNDLEIIGSAALRRMTYAIGFKIPPLKTRTHIWKKYNTKYDLKLTDETIDFLAVTYDVAPALIANTAKVVHLAGIDEDAIKQVVSNLDTLVNLGSSRTTKNETNGQVHEFQPEITNAELDLDTLLEKLERCKTPNFSLCLYGPPGTGKSAFGRHIAKVMGKKVSFKRTSDIQSKWVGECEQNMAKMFEEASDSEKLLILDEADTFLRSREHAKNSWEVSQTNEMLTQMEVHDQPFVATTNLVDILDEATLRRFTFKLKFDFLRKDQLERAFQFFFKQSAPTNIMNMSILTPGDFANVKKRADILGIEDANELGTMLVEECKLKPQQNKSTMGFTVEPQKAKTLEFKKTDEVASDDNNKN